MRRYLEPLRRAILPELVGDPETLIVDCTLLAVLYPRQVSQSAGFEGAAWVRWGSFSVYGVKLHLLCATNRVPLSYELTPANVAEIGLTEELLVEADLGEEIARELFADLAYRSEQLEDDLAECGIRLVTEPSNGAWEEAAARGCFGEPQEGLSFRRDLGHHARRIGHEDRGQDLRLHLRFLHQPDAGSSSREDQGVVGMNLATLI